MSLTRSFLQSRPSPRVHRDGRCVPVAAADCARGTGDVNAGTRASTPDGAPSRCAARAPGCRGSPHPSGACGASIAVGVRAGSPAGYRSAAEELAGTAGNSPHRLHSAGAAWLHPRDASPGHAMGALKIGRKSNPFRHGTASGFRLLILPVLSPSTGSHPQGSLTRSGRSSGAAPSRSSWSTRKLECPNHQQALGQKLLWVRKCERRRVKSDERQRLHAESKAWRNRRHNPR